MIRSQQLPLDVAPRLSFFPLPFNSSELSLPPTIFVSLFAEPERGPELKHPNREKLAKALAASAKDLANELDKSGALPPADAAKKLRELLNGLGSAIEDSGGKNPLSPDRTALIERLTDIQEYCAANGVSFALRLEPSEGGKFKISFVLSRLDDKPLILKVPAGLRVKDVDFAKLEPAPVWRAGEILTGTKFVAFQGICTMSMKRSTQALVLAPVLEQSRTSAERHFTRLLGLSKEEFKKIAPEVAASEQDIAFNEAGHVWFGDITKVKPGDLTRKVTVGSRKDVSVNEINEAFSDYSTFAATKHPAYQAFKVLLSDGHGYGLSQSLIKDAIDSAAENSKVLKALTDDERSEVTKTPRGILAFACRNRAFEAELKVALLKTFKEFHDEAIPKVRDGVAARWKE